LGKKRFTILTILVLLMLSLPIRSEKSAMVQSTQDLDSRGIGEGFLATRDYIEFSSTSSVPRILWNKTYGGAGEDTAYSAAQTPDGGHVLAGYTYSFGDGGADFWLAKTDYFGNMESNKTYGGSGNDKAHSVTRTRDGGYATLGTTDSFGVGASDFWLVKTDSSGNMLWNRTYGGAGDDDAWSIKETTDGYLVLAGWTTSFGAGSGDFWLIKTDQYGNMLWNKTYGGGLFEAAYCVQQTSDAGFALLGSTYSFGDGGADFWLVKTDAAGNEQWNKTYGGTADDFGFSLVETEDGYALAGSASSFGAGVYDFWLVKTDQLGNAMWNKTYGGTGYDEAWSIMQTPNKEYVLTGWTESIGSGSSDCWLVVTNALGDVQWNVTWGGTNNDYAYSALQAYDGNFILAGETQSFGAGSGDFLSAKILAASTILKTVVGQGFSMSINATVTNLPILAETFNVTAWINTTNIGVQSVTLASKASAIITFTWNTTSYAKGNYTMSVVADVAPNETYTLIEGWVTVTIPGDIEGNFKVQLADLVSLAQAYGSQPGDPNWNANTDIDGNNIVGLSDLVTLANHYGQHYP
jgi:hypothetical protein